jgi:hypothetical protein
MERTISIGSEWRNSIRKGEISKIAFNGKLGSRNFLLVLSTNRD